MWLQVKFFVYQMICLYILTSYADQRVTSIEGISASDANNILLVKYSLKFY